MEVYLNRIDGWDDAILSMFYSKRTITRELEEEVRNVVYECTNHDPSKGVVGSIVKFPEPTIDYDKNSPEYKLYKWSKSLFKWAWTHITLGRFLDFSFTVYGLHRAGQD